MEVEEGGVKGREVEGGGKGEGGKGGGGTGGGGGGRREWTHNNKH